MAVLQKGLNVMIMFIMRNNYVLSNTCSYTLVCPPVRGDNPRALARRLSPHTGGQTMV